MLPAYVLRPLLRYLDGVDEVVSAGLVTARPHMEWSLTSDLCSLMDEEEQSRYALRHRLPWLRRRLAERLPGVNIEFSIDTHEYPSHLENLVTQSDLGLIVEFVDHVLPERSWQTATLLQAKRLTPRRASGEYNGDSNYGSLDNRQHARIRALHEILGYPIVRYLLYTPRPEKLRPDVAAELRYRRDVNLSQYIFDYTDGLTIHRELTRKRRFVDGGIVVSPVVPKPKTLRDTYSRIFDDNLTLSWYLALLLIERQPGDNAPGGITPKRLYAEDGEKLAISPILLARGHHTAANAVVERLRDESVDTFPMLPSRSITIHVATGREEFVDRRG